MADTLREYKGEKFILSEIVDFRSGFVMYATPNHGNIVRFVKLSEVNQIVYTTFGWGYIPDFIDEDFINMLWEKSINSYVDRDDARLKSVYPIYDIDKYNDKLEKMEQERHQEKEVLFTDSMAGYLVGSSKAVVRKVRGVL